MAKKPTQTITEVTPATRQEVEIRLRELCDSHGERLTPELVLADASDPASPLHDEFDWDDTTAAHAYRIEQARRLIRTVVYRFKTEVRQMKVAYYVRDPKSERGEAAYLPIIKVRSDEDLSREVLIKSFERVSNALETAKKYATLFGMEREIQEFIQQADIMRARAAQYTGTLNA